MQFDRTRQALERARRFGAELDELCRRAAPWPGEAAALGELRDAYARRMAAFFHEGHRFSLAVIGQVKAGKSTFLNTLLFGGHPLLPQAASPKTAVLTRLEYAPQPCLTVEYYTDEDWALLEQAAAVPLESPAARGARDILQAARDPQRRRACARLGAAHFPCPDEQALRTLLEDTAGGRGPDAPYVKCVTLALCREELQGLSVADTPGLNDPVASRSQRTREFLEECDAAFFLSHSGYFLDETDLALLSAQLPLRGVRGLCLVGSRFDGALAAAGPGADPQTVAQALTLRARQKTEQVLRTLERAGTPAPVLEVVDACRRPIFVSAVAHAMAGIPPEDYTPLQQAVARSLFAGAPPEPAALARIGGMAAVEERFAQFARSRDVLLARKADGFAAVAQAQLQELTGRLCQARRDRAGELAAQETQLLAASARLAEDIRRITARVDALFAEYSRPLETLVQNARQTLAQMAGQAPAPAARTEVTLHSQATTVSDARLWKPWTWGRSHREYAVHQTDRPYWEAADTVGFLQEFPREFRLLWDGVYVPMLDTAALQNQLVLYARQTLLDLGCPADGQAVLAMARRALAHIAAPRFTFGTEALQAELRRQFPARAADGPGRAALEEGCRLAVQQAARQAGEALDEGARRFARTVHGAQEDFTARLLEPVSARRRSLEQQLADLRRQRAECQEAAEVLRR